MGVVSFLVVSALFFGKNLISYSAFRYYCSHKAGLTVYKTLAQWQQENPGVWETLKQVNDFRDYQDREKYPDVPLEKEFDGKIYTTSWDGNQRIILYDNAKYILWGALSIYSEILIDNQTQEILADYYYFKWINTWDTEPSEYGREGLGFLGHGFCNPEAEREKYSAYRQSFNNPSLTEEEKSDE